jgi:hypothetical protein
MTNNQNNKIVRKSRGKSKLISDYTFKDAYKIYKKEVIKELQVDKKTYTKIIKLANKIIIDKLLYESESVKLPFKLGTLRIKKNKINYSTNRLSVDWKTTLETGYKVLHLNEHRNGYRYRFYWNKKGANIKNITCYSFTPSRSSKRLLAKILKYKPEIDYFE